MTRRANLLRGVLAALTISLVSGCDLLEDLFAEKLTPTERIDAFIDELNTASRTTIGEQLHPLANDFQALQSSDLWESGPLRTENRDFSWTEGTTTDNGTTVDITGILTSLFGAQPFTNALFTLQEDGEDNWKIRLLDLDTTDVDTPWDITKLY